LKDVGLLHAVAVKLKIYVMFLKTWVVKLLGAAKGKLGGGLCSTQIVVSEKKTKRELLIVKQ
jgi:hypothetical protein